MTSRMTRFLFLLSMAVLIESMSENIPSRDCDCQCRRERVSYQRPIFGKGVSTKQRYTTKCGFLGWGRCSRYRTQWTSTITGYTIGYRLKECNPRDCPCPPAERSCDCECLHRRERVSYQRPIYKKGVSIKQRYTTKCGFLGWGRCTRYRTKWTSIITGYTRGYRLKECYTRDCPCPPSGPREGRH